ncbi:MAG: AAC(3) family N-acetyltransferase, partial [Thermoanaerobaculia bacterium]
LFSAANGGKVTRKGLEGALRAVGAADCDVLFVHNGMKLGAPNPDLGRIAFLDSIWETLLALRVPTICLPTFTFSFPNGQAYDREKSRTRMGALSEHARRLPGAVRSIDPILSVAVVGSEHALAESIGRYSCGPDSIYDLLHRRGGGVTFLFLGVRAHECFTFSHFVEERAGVPFRYHRPFHGEIRAGGRTWQETFFHYARFNGVRPVPDDRLERDLHDSGLLRRTPLGDGWISAVDEAAAYPFLLDRLRREPFYLADTELRDKRFLERDVVAL